MTDVKKMRSPQTTGEDHPVPGMSVFHATFWVELQVSGRLASSAIPSDSGPRNCGQRSDTAALMVWARKRRQSNRVMGVPRWGLYQYYLTHHRNCDNNKSSLPDLPRPAKKSAASTG